MKKLGLVIAIACLAAGTVFSQNRGNVWGTISQAVSITGTLQLQNGTIAVTSGSNAYFVPALTQYIGFIEGLREGAQVSIDGFASGNYIQPSRVTINGKTYDFTVNAPQGMAYGSNNWGYCGNYARAGSGWGGNRGGGWGGCW